MGEAIDMMKGFLAGADLSEEKGLAGGNATGRCQAEEDPEHELA